MMPRFENGIKFILLLLITKVSSRSYSDKQQHDQVQPQYKLDRDQTEWKQLDLDRLTVTKKGPAQWTSNVLTVTKKGPAEWSSDSRNDPEPEGRYSQIVNPVESQSQRVHRQRSSNRGTFLSRLLESRQGPVVVFLTQGTDVDLDAQNTPQLKANDENEVSAESDEEPLVKYVPTKEENDAYVLYNVLRTTQEDEDLDPQANAEIEKTKEILQETFALRCGAKSTCERKCPEKKPKCPKNCAKVEKKAKNDCKRKCPSKKTCERKCERIVEEKVDECEQKIDECEQEQEEQCEAKCTKIYDELDACPKKKKNTCGPKCGKTMPPNWLLRAREFLW